MTCKAILQCIFYVATAVATDITVSTTSGRISGAVEPTWGIAIARFLGIPYAKPPLGSLRYRPPEPASPWQGVLETKEFRAACAQANGSFPPETPWLVDKRIVSEDCLFLNIWAPQTCTKRKAILIWIHGGGFRTGTPSTELYDGKLLAAVGDIVVASVAYRLGSTGFLHTGEDSSPGNYGLLDQELAIHWIRDNAEVFGGDRSSITLYGESAGSASVGLHLLATRNGGIVRRAIMGSWSPYGLIPSQNEVGRELATTLAKAAGCEGVGDDWIKVVSCLRSVSIEAILGAEDTQYPQDLVTFMPSYGNGYLPLSFQETLRDPNLVPIDALLIGITADEGSIFLYTKDPERFNMKNEPEGLTYSEALALLACPYYPRLPKALQNATTGIFKASVQDGEGILQSLINAVGDLIMTCPTQFFAEAYARLNYPVYFYVFDHRSVKSRLPPWMAAAHFTELQYTFGMPFRFPERYTDLDREQSMLMMELFTDFINTGRPMLQDGSEWPTYTKEDPYHENPNVIAKDIRSAAQEKVEPHLVNNDESMCIPVKTEGALSNLLDHRKVAGVHVEVIIPPSYVKKRGKINDVLLVYTNDDLACYLASAAGLNAAEFVPVLTTWTTARLGGNRSVALSTVALTFCRILILHTVRLVNWSTFREYSTGLVQPDMSAEQLTDVLSASLRSSS
ncbi:cholinesterase 1-like [Ornithodoros turicata]|uniref:cholinesterase 1-like n=1 Tax=Ornithodoros turicata TaxID=34597 RepID=UPI00313893FD